MSRAASGLRLREIKAEDWPEVHAFAGLAEVCRYQPWGPNTAAESEEFVAGAVAAWAEDPQVRFVYAACLADEVVGLGELKIRSRRNQHAEIGYVVHPRVWGRGVATGIGERLLAMGFALRMHRISATCDPRNEASVAVLRKLGMTYEGRLRHHMLLRDGWRDSEMFSILDTD